MTSRHSQKAEVGSEVNMAYIGMLADGSKFDSASTFKFVLGAGEVIKGWDKGVLGMVVGETRFVFISELLFPLAPLCWISSVDHINASIFVLDVDLSAMKRG